MEDARSDMARPMVTMNEAEITHPQIMLTGPP